MIRFARSNEEQSIAHLSDCFEADGIVPLKQVQVPFFGDLPEYYLRFETSEGQCTFGDAFGNPRRNVFFNCSAPFTSVIL